jgi:hypothetical protein
VPRRRAITGQPLLVVSAGALLAACGGRHKPVGNLMMPEPEPVEQPAGLSVELCVDTSPAGAEVRVDGDLASDRCTTVEGAQGDIVRIEVSAEGFQTESVELRLAPGLAPVAVTLEPAPAEIPEVIPPVGNLMLPHE